MGYFFLLDSLYSFSFSNSPFFMIDIQPRVDQDRFISDLILLSDPLSIVFYLI